VRVRHVLIAAGIVATAASCAGVPIFDPPAPRAPATGAAAQVVDGRGPLPPAQSAVVVRRLERQGHTDLLAHHLEASVAAPLVVGNDARLLVDGPATHRAMFEAIARARDHVNLETYILEADAIGQRLAELLIRKRAQGVRVNVLYDSVGSIKTPAEYFQQLLAAGVQILERHDALLHAKTVVIDGVWSSVGSTNLDWRSFVHNYEADVIVLSAAFARDMERLFALDLDASHEITLDAWRRRGLGSRVTEWFARRWEYFL